MIDAKQVFSNAQDINSATTDSTNIIDLDAATPYSGRGYMPRFRAVVNTKVGTVSAGLADAYLYNLN